MEIVTRAQALAKGLKRYFTGKPCKHGHVAERHSADGACYECRGRLNAASYQRHRERRISHVMERYYENPTARIEQIVKWANENRERVRGNHRSWSHKNHGKVYANTRNQQARRRGAIGTHTQEDIEEIRRMQRNRCAYCPEILGDDYEVDHIVPLKKGGTNFRKNIQLACPSCNKKKNAKDPIIFARLLGKLI